MTKQMKVLFGVLFFSFLFFQCGEKSPNSETDIPRSVKQYCGSCHIVPEPQSLTKEVWANSIIPKMSQFYIWNPKSKHTYANTSFYSKQGNIPMDDENWDEIVDYYLTFGLDNEHIDSLKNWPIQTFFDEVIVDFEDEYPSEVTAALIQNDKILIGSGRALHRLNEDLSLDMLIPLNRDITHIYPHKEQIYLVSTSTINPHHGPFGEVAILNQSMDSAQLLYDKLERPVQIYINGSDILTSEFGFKSGQLSIRNSESLNESKSIHNLPGSYRIMPAQLIKNEDKTLVISLSQAQEGIFALIKKDTGYDVKELIRFKPEYGLSDIDIADINGDGLDDLLIVNGDNADYSIIPKAFHGMKIYLNRGNYRFEKVYNFNIHGATQGKLIDVDKDGKIDVVLSCYFAELSHHKIVLLKNISEEKISFSPYVFRNSKKGNWMIMEKGDINHDGEDDLLLGSYDLGPKQMQDSISFMTADVLLLINQSDK